MDLYERLGVARDASPEEIKAAHRRAAKAAHPDAGGDVARFYDVQHAYGILSDQRRRAHYDATGHAAQADPAALLDAQARTILVGKANQVISNPVIDPRYFDLVVGICELLQTEMAQGRETIMANKAQMVRMKSFARRLKRRAGPAGPSLVEMIQGHVEQIQGIVANCEHQMDVLQRALELAGEYRYETEQQPMMHMTRAGPGFGGGGWS